MGFIDKLLGKDPFKKISELGEKIQGIGETIMVWERRRATIEGEKAAAYSRLMDLREQELDGKSDPDALAAARAQCGTMDEKLAACSRKILTLHEELSTAIADEIELRHQTAGDRLATLEAERRQKHHEIAEYLATAVALRDAYWSVGRDRPFEMQSRVDGFDSALAKAKAEVPAAGEFLAAVQSARDDACLAPNSAPCVGACAVRAKALLKNLRAEVES